MGSGKKLVTRVGLANSFIETTILRADEASLSGNIKAAHALATVIDAAQSPYERKNQGRLVTDVQVEHVLAFIRRFNNHEGSILTLGDPVARYIADRAASELLEWDVLFASLAEDKDGSLTSSALGFPIHRQERRAGVRTEGNTIHVGEKQRVASRGVERVGVPEELVRAAETDYRTSNTSNVPDRIYRAVRPKPLLIIHLLKMLANTEAQKQGQRTGSFAGLDRPVVAWSISFPRTATPEDTVEYIVNTTWIRENLGEDDEDDESRDEAA